jgi:hypothetical protein
VDLSRRVHRFGHKGIGASVIELALDPVMLFLFLKPSRRQRVWTKGSSPALKQLDHHEGVVALRLLDS